MDVPYDPPNENYGEVWPLKRLRVYSLEDGRTIAFAANAMKAFDYAHRAGLSRSGLWASKWCELTEKSAKQSENVKKFTHPVLGVINGYSNIEEYNDALKSWSKCNELDQRQDPGDAKRDPR